MHKQDKGVVANVWEQLIKLSKDQARNPDELRITYSFLNVGEQQEDKK